MTEKIYLTEADLIERGVLKSLGTAGRAVKRGQLPPPVRVGQRNLWKWTAVQEHLEALAAPRVVVRGAR